MTRNDRFLEVQPRFLGLFRVFLIDRGGIQKRELIHSQLIIIHPSEIRGVFSGKQDPAGDRRVAEHPRMKKKNIPAKRAVRSVKSTRRPDIPPVDGLFERVASILDEARSGVVRAVNHRMVIAYWLIGREIVLEQQGGDERAEYGAVLLKSLSERLTQRYGGGYSLSSLKDFRLFYSTFADRGTLIGHALRGQSMDDATTNTSGKSHPLRGQFVKSQLSDRWTPESPTNPPFHPSLSWTQYRTLMMSGRSEITTGFEGKCRRNS